MVSSSIKFILLFVLQMFTYFYLFLHWLVIPTCKCRAVQIVNSGNSSANRLNIRATVMWIGGVMRTGGWNNIWMLAGEVLAILQEAMGTMTNCLEIVWKGPKCYILYSSFLPLSNVQLLQRWSRSVTAIQRAGATALVFARPCCSWLWSL